MLEGSTIWATPARLRSWAGGAVPHEAALKLEARLADYVETACRPVLHVSPAETSHLGPIVAKYAVLGNEARLRFVLALSELVSKPEDLLSLSVEGSAKSVVDVREDAKHLLDADALDLLRDGSPSTRTRPHAPHALRRGVPPAPSLPRSA